MLLTDAEQKFTINQEKALKNKLIFNLILLLMVASGCALTPAIAKEAEKPETAVASAARLEHLPGRSLNGILISEK